MDYRKFLELEPEVIQTLVDTYHEQRAIRDTRKSIEAAQKLVEQRTIINQNSCNHPGATRTPRANTGNYDPGCDSYWMHCVCPDCGKIWQEDQ